MDLKRSCLRATVQRRLNVVWQWMRNNLDHKRNCTTNIIYPCSLACIWKNVASVLCYDVKMKVTDRSLSLKQLLNKKKVWECTTNVWKLLRSPWFAILRHYSYSFGKDFQKIGKILTFFYLFVAMFLMHTYPSKRSSFQLHFYNIKIRYFAWIWQQHSETLLK